MNLTDGKAHEVSLYGLDWDSTSRSETIQVLDAATGGRARHAEPLVVPQRDLPELEHQRARGLPGHQGGRRQRRPQRPLLRRCDPQGGSATFLATDTTTQGSWKGVYGADGYNVINNQASYPSYATVTPSGQSASTWAASTSDVRALQKAAAADRIAATWYASGSTFSVDVNLTDGKAHEVSLYGLDWDSTTRSETIQVLDAATEAVLDTRSLSSFHNGTYLSWNISGHVVFQFTKVGGATPSSAASSSTLHQRGAARPW